MIVSRTPLRISFAGGGTDLPVFYKKETGEVISAAINKYMYVTVNKRFDDTIRFSYTKTEIVNDFNKLRHELIREAMRLTGIVGGVEITTIADIPAKGSGLGSSSSLTVGTLNALYAYKGERVHTKQLAEEACRIEIEIIKEPIGKQDQFITAYGGLKHFYFKPNSDVVVEPLLVNRKRAKRLEKNLMLFYTNVTRKASAILYEQRRNSVRMFEELRGLKSLVPEVRDCLEKEGRDLDDFGRILNKGWELKKKLAHGISNDTIDTYYRKALDAGAIGGKILGAGGGGFLLLYCRPDLQGRVRSALKCLRYMPVLFEQEGSKVIYADL